MLIICDWVVEEPNSQWKDEVEETLALDLNITHHNFVYNGNHLIWEESIVYLEFNFWLPSTHACVIGLRLIVW